MFCPQCGTENEAEQSFCRKCGLPLSAVRLAVDGSVAKALAKVKQSDKALRNGTFVSALLLAITLYAAVRSGPFEIVIDPLVLRISNWMVGLFVTLVLGLPIVIVGLIRLRHARRLLEAPQEKPTSLLNEDGNTTALPPATTISVTEETTMKLPEQVRRR